MNQINIITREDVVKIVSEELEKQNKKSQESKLSNAYDSWSFEEDTHLAHEFSLFLICVADSHKRSPGAIRARLAKKEMVY